MKVKMPARDDVEIDMAPMIDMVFLLLIFFMVASIAAKERVEIEALPRSGHAKIPEDMTGRMILSLDADSNLYDDMELIEMDDLKRRIEQRRASERDPVTRVLIRADERVRYKECIKLMKICGEAGVSDIIYSAYSGGNG
ncbi:MAG: biopolymer transporter ExbD [Pontiellaceae bacterium]|nr:biopolymer transporter ExbD [Pontiellaceae bacterium]